MQSSDSSSGTGGSEEKVCGIGLVILGNSYVVILFSMTLLTSSVFLLIPFFTHLGRRWWRYRNKGLLLLTSETLPININMNREEDEEEKEVELRPDSTLIFVPKSVSAPNNINKISKSSSPSTLTPFLKFYLGFLFFWFLIEAVVSYFLQKE